MIEQNDSFLEASEIDPELAAIVRALTDRMAAGEQLDPKSILAEHPDQADALRELIPTLQAVAEAGRKPSESSQPNEAPAPEIRALGDFKIVREIGRGGMGIVYEALQLSLGRRVALKVLPFAGMLDERRLARFQNEARAAATLQHQHVVPVFFVGSERGVNFYAMQLIDGISVAEMVGALRASEVEETSPEASTQRNVAALEPTSTWSAERRLRRSVYFRTVAEAVRCAAEAIDHAHQYGVLHRDVKPGNLLLDRSGKLWVTDFGLARLEGDAGLSLTGDLAGTLRYLPPEVVQAQRPAVDQRADVYSLGATLYEMLVLQPAFDEADRAKLLRQILVDDPTPLGEIDPSVPPELQTIVQRAMEKRPDDRFASAQLLADELQRFLDHRPLKTKPPGLAARSAKWCRRHPSIVSAGAAATLVAVVALAVLVGVLTQNQNRLQAAFAAERDERRRADENLRLAKQAVDEWYVRFAEEHLDDQPGMTDDQLALLEKAAEFYSLYSAREAEADYRKDQAATLNRLAQLQHKLADLNGAEQSIAQAISIARQLASQAPNSLDARLLLADCLQTSASLHNQRGNFEREYELSEHALGELNQLSQEVRSNANWRLGVARLHRRLSVCGQRLGRLQEADAHAEQAAAEIADLLRESPDDWELQRERAFCLENQVALRLKRDSPLTITAELRDGFSREDTAKMYREVLAAAADWLKREPRSVAARSNLYHVSQLAGSLLPDDEAEAALRRNLRTAEELRAEFPERAVLYSRMVSHAYHVLEHFYSRRGRDVDALEAARGDLANQQASRELTSPKDYKLRAGAHRVAATALVRLKRYDEARSSYEASIELLETGLARIAAGEIGPETEAESLQRDLETSRQGLRQAVSGPGESTTAVPSFRE